MGAASADVPAIVVPGGPMLSGQWRDRKLGAGTDGRKLFDLFRAGQITEEDWSEIQGGLARSAGHCTVMGTASTMTSLAEALGMALPGSANIPAVDSRRLVSAEMSGRRAVELAIENLRPSQIMTARAFENAITVDMAIGGSTNAVVHLIAIAGRLGLPLPLQEFDRISRRTPCITNVKPSGEYLMEDFFEAGGVRAVMREVLHLLNGDLLTVNGRTVADNVQSAPCYRSEVIRPFTEPLSQEGGTVVLHGNLAPDGAVLKQTAASEHLMLHRGPAYVFESYEHMRAQIDRDDLAVTPSSVLVMKNCGPKGGPGFPEWGHIPMPRVLLRQGVNDIVRISDARMSGTSFGTVVLHIAPESAVGGPLAAVQTGDEIQLDVERRTISVLLPPAELEARMTAHVPSVKSYERGYARLFMERVLQANEGCDFDFLRSIPK